MDLFASQVPALFAGVAANANRSVDEVLDPAQTSWSSQHMRDVLALDHTMRPAGQAAASRGYAVRYLGDQRAIVARLLHERFPRSADRMHPAPIGYVRMWARADAGCYQTEADRYLVDVNGARVENDAMQEAATRRWERARISEVAPESERRACTGLRSTVVHVGHLPGIDGEPSREVLTHYWPHDVVVLTHRAFPGEDAAIVFIGLRQAHAYDERGNIIERWLCYKRDTVDDEAGVPMSWGPWQTTEWRSDRYSALWTEYAGTLLPVVTLRLESPDGGYWPAADRDSITAADQLNMSRANADFILDLQAHSILVVSDDNFDEQDMSAAPDGVLGLKTESTASYLTPAPAFDAMAASMTERQETLAAARGNDPNAYAARDGAPESGVARLVAKFPHELSLRERREVVRRFDERLSRVILDVADAFAVDAPTFGVTNVRTDLAPSVVFEDPTAKIDRAQRLLDSGAISPAEFVVEVGRYRNVQAAVADGYSNEARMRTPAPARPSVAMAIMERETDATGE